MNVHSLALRMRDLGSWLDYHEHPAVERHEFDRAPYGRARITIDPLSVAPAASFNCNRIVLCGADGGLTQDGLEQLVEMFGGRGVPRLFVWLSPGPDDARVQEWLQPPRFVRVPWTRYPTMLFGAPTEAPRAHRFEIRETGESEFAAVQPALGEAVFDGYVRTLGKTGFNHYLLFDGNRPIALGALARFGEIGYLTYGATVETDRRRGAQTALIAHRAEVARSLGCAHIVSQTLTMLEESFENLQRCGFREIYEQEVYEVMV